MAGPYRCLLGACLSVLRGSAWSSRIYSINYSRAINTHPQQGPDGQVEQLELVPPIRSMSRCGGNLGLPAGAMRDTESCVQW
ncbi:hypothetical protein FIBSPDRAFT_850490 [Athelia psychrophila]|uniref:Secreted protein n=1 Tax=Athelia psychrophila TaxID=1759441 RepID=A0A166TGP0_9AGAM|nr:hypothetical protein FIBSPDRAFT_850490 [Fibularhizoctonia sp. CBS 109695]